MGLRWYEGLYGPCIQRSQPGSRQDKVVKGWAGPTTECSFPLSLPLSFPLPFPLSFPLSFPLPFPLTFSCLFLCLFLCLFFCLLFFLQSLRKWGPPGHYDWVMSVRDRSMVMFKKPVAATIMSNHSTFRFGFRRYRLYHRANLNWQHNFGPLIQNTPATTPAFLLHITLFFIPALGEPTITSALACSK